MPTRALTPRPHPPTGPTLYLALGATLGLSATLLLNALLTRPSNSHSSPQKAIIPSPLKTRLPTLTPSEIASLPYPPDILPGSRSVPTPYGTIHVFEFGPEDGEKVLLLHGISTPCVSLAALAEALAARGYRVMLFDLFGRGYSDTPGGGAEFDMRLFTTQILLVLASSRLCWTGDDAFHLVGYSLGGGLAVGFARYFAGMVRSVVVVAGGGLVRKAHVGWKTKVLYSKGWVPEGVLHWFIGRRLMPQQGAKDATETRMAAEVVQVKKSQENGEDWHKNGDVSGGDSFDNAVLLARRPGYTVSSVMGWQMRHHLGFVPAFVSSIRYAPIYEQTEDWCALGQMLAARREDTATELPGLRGGKILMVLGASDPIVLKEELIHDATAVFGEDGFEAVVLDAGHEVVMTNAEDIANVASGFWRRSQGVGQRN